MAKLWACVTLLVLSLAGCNRQDTDALSRIGRKIAERAQEATAGLREKISTGLPEMGSLHHRVQRRLHWDKALEGASIDLHVQGVEVELRGTVKTFEQRRRAVDLVENTQGVEKILDNLRLESGE